MSTLDQAASEAHSDTDAASPVQRSKRSREQDNDGEVEEAGVVERAQQRNLDENGPAGSTNQQQLNQQEEEEEDKGTGFPTGAAPLSVGGGGGIGVGIADLYLPQPPSRSIAPTATTTTTTAGGGGGTTSENTFGGAGGYPEKIWKKSGNEFWTPQLAAVADSAAAVGSQRSTQGRPSDNSTGSSVGGNSGSSKAPVMKDITKFFKQQGPSLEERLISRQLLPIECRLSLKHKGSLFKSFAVVSPNLKSSSDVLNVVKYLKQDAQIQQATHVSYWYSLEPMMKGRPRQVGGDDDKEAKAKITIQSAVEPKRVEYDAALGVPPGGKDDKIKYGVLIIVCRWFGGQLLGPARFDHITELSKTAFDQGWKKFLLDPPPPPPPPPPPSTAPVPAVLANAKNVSSNKSKSEAKAAVDTEVIDLAQEESIKPASSTTPCTTATKGTTSSMPISSKTVIETTTSHNIDDEVIVID